MAHLNDITRPTKILPLNITDPAVSNTIADAVRQLNITTSHQYDPIGANFDLAAIGVNKYEALTNIAQESFTPTGEVVAQKIYELTRISHPHS